MNRKYIVFGTGTGGKRVLEMLKQFQDIEVEYCLDNNPKSELFEGIPVIKAGKFLEQNSNQDYNYCIASVYRDDIKKQLLQSGISENQIVSIISIMLEHENIIDSIIKHKKISNHPYETIIFDLGLGFGLGGVEKWSYNIANELKKKGKNIVLFSNNSDGLPPYNLSKNAYKSVVDCFSDYKLSSINNIMNEIEQMMPCTIFVAHISDLMIAAMMLKTRYPDKIKIISVIHGGLDYLIEDNLKIANRIDYLMCISFDMYQIIKKCKEIDKKKVLFKETPVKISDVKEKKYTLDNKQPIKIAYAARLEKLHKHSELVILFIEELEKKQVNYALDIAGTGTMYKMIYEFIQQKKLTNKVNMLGKVEYRDMEQFWLKHDIAVNFSECEGCSVTMLESMSAGTVPIFTDVFSTRHFIADGNNGFVVEFNDVNGMVQDIIELDKNRNKISEMGYKAHQTIQEKCIMSDYIEYILKNIK